MEDFKIVNLYWERSERAIAETQNKYSRMMHSLSYSVLSSHEDAEECVNDTLLKAWNSMPTDRPTYLGAYLSKIVRRLSLDRYRSRKRQKRDGVELALDELAECIPSNLGVESAWDEKHLTDILERYLKNQSQEKRIMFIRRYFHAKTIPEIAEGMGVTEVKVRVTLHRMRDDLRSILEKEEIL